jgi:6-phosphogluconolactonase
MLKVLPDPETLAREAAKFVAAVGIGRVYSLGRFDLVLAGGRTPLPIYNQLAAEFGHQMRLWTHTHIWWGDERCVSPGNHQSNFHAARLGLLMPLAIAEDRVHRIRGEAADLREAAADYAKAFPVSPDVVVLGLGEDGHIASLFPGAAALREEEHRVVVVENCPKPPSRRITITPPVIRSARRVLVVARGAAKAEAVRRTFAEEGSVEETPARLVRDALWMVDQEAAAKLGA